MSFKLFHFRKLIVCDAGVNTQQFRLSVQIFERPRELVNLLYRLELGLLLLSRSDQQLA